MKDFTYILNEERSRILNLHKKHFLNELNPSKLLKTINEEVVKPEGDPYAYKREGVNYYVARVGRTGQPNATTKWTQAKNDHQIREIERIVFGNTSGNNLDTDNKDEVSATERCQFNKNKFTEGGLVALFREYPNDKGCTMFKKGDKVSISGYSKDGANLINGATRVYDVPDALTIVLDKPWPKGKTGITDETAIVAKVYDKPSAVTQTT